MHLVWHGTWDEAAPAAQLLAACVPAWLLVYAGRALIEARGEWRMRFVMLGIYGVGGMGAAAVGTLIGGVHAIAAAVTLFYVVFALGFVLVLNRLGLPIRGTVGSLVAPLALTGAALLLGKFAAGALLARDAAPLLQDATALATFLVVVALGSAMFFKDIWHEIAGALTQRLRRVGP
jgi:hypothetical protein